LVVRWDYWIGVIGVFSIVESSFVEYNWLAWEGPWSVFMENSETISTHRMSNIVSKLTQFKSDWTYFTRGWRSDRVDLQIKPESISRSSGSVISHPDVIWVRDPERSWCRVCV
jgi:hypothetical protein